MKNAFYNAEGKNTAVVECQTGDYIFKLYYHLYNNPVQFTWQTIHQKNENIITKSSLAESIDSLTSKLNFYCLEEGVGALPEPITQDFLNWLHNKFVESSKNSNWHSINEIIHTIEPKLKDAFSNYDSTLSFYAATEQFVPLQEEYKIFLNTDIKWGRMLLGYGTLGKDWIDIAKDNDCLNDLSIQQTISSETQLTFCVEPPFTGLNEYRVFKFSQESGLPVPLNDLNKMSLGRYPLGQLIITNSLIDFHNNPADWYVPNHKCKLLWNKEVFNESVKINKISFEDTDLLYESLLAHGELAGVLNA